MNGYSHQFVKISSTLLFSVSVDTTSLDIPYPGLRSRGTHSGENTVRTGLGPENGASVATGGLERAQENSIGLSIAPLIDASGY